LNRNSGPHAPEAAPDTRLARWAENPAGPALLCLFAVLEASAFPAPTEALFVALALVRPARSWWLAALTTGASGVGSLLGYGIGFFLWNPVGRPVLEWLELTARFEAMGRLYHDNLFLALVTSGYTPIPYLLYTIAGGAFEVPLLPFLAGALVGRGIKYLVIGTLTFYLGPTVRHVLARHFRWVAAFLAVLLLAALVFWRR
jgi:membrane protein YqaA with SNARE-associated domain